MSPTPDARGPNSGHDRNDRDGGRGRDGRDSRDGREGRHIRDGRDGRDEPHKTHGLDRPGKPDKDVAEAVGAVWRLLGDSSLGTPDIRRIYEEVDDDTVALARVRAFIERHHDYEPWWRDHHDDPDELRGLAARLSDVEVISSLEHLASTTRRRRRRRRQSLRHSTPRPRMPRSRTFRWRAPWRRAHLPWPAHLPRRARRWAPRDRARRGWLPGRPAGRLGLAIVSVVLGVTAGLLSLPGLIVLIVVITIALLGRLWFAHGDGLVRGFHERQARWESEAAAYTQPFAALFRTRAEQPIYRSRLSPHPPPVLSGGGGSSVLDPVEFRPVTTLADVGVAASVLAGRSHVVFRAGRRWERPSARSFWRSLTSAEQQALSAVAGRRTFAPGEVLCREGHPADDVMVIRSGWTKVSIRRVGGERIIAMRGPGDLIGERAVLLERARSATVTALDTVKTLLMPGEEFTAFLSGHERVLAVVERQIYNQLAEDGARAFTREPADVERRLAFPMLEVLLRQRGETGDISAATLPLSLDELAQWVDASRDTIERVLTAWQARGVIRVSQGRGPRAARPARGLIPARGASGGSSGSGGRAKRGRHERRAHRTDHPPPESGQDGMHRSEREGLAGGTGLTTVIEVLDVIELQRICNETWHPLSLRADQNCSILLTDIAGFGARDRTDQDRLLIRRTMYELLQKAFETSGLPWGACHLEDRGDGALVIIPPGMPVSRAVDPLLAKLGTALKRHNAAARGGGRIQLRVALHMGPVVSDPVGVSGQTIIHAADLLESTVFKRRLAESAASLGVIVSTPVYNTVIQHTPAVDPATYHRVQVPARESMLTAWLRLFEPAQRSA